jgi:two-component system, OmpR family, sensor histidine kinase MprB
VSLRARLALALALLAAAAVIAVGVTGYVSTSRGLYDELDRSLKSYGTRYADPDGNSARLLCATLAGSDAGPGPGGSDAGNAPPPGTTVQCVSSSGEAVARSSSTRIPLDHDDKELAASGGAPAELRTQKVNGTKFRILTIPVGTGGAVQLARDLEETDHVLDRLRNRYLLIGFLTIGAAALAGWLIARRVVRPLNRLTQAAEQISETGNLEADIPTAGRDETGRLARAFATMLDALTNSRQQQQRLAQDAGHELRTPLTSLRTNIDTLRRYRKLPDDTRGRVLDDLDLESHELNALVDELVDLVTDQRDDEPERPLDLDDLVGRAVDRARRRSGRTITLDAQPSRIVGRPRQLLRAIDNVLDNAAKFSPDDSPIEVSVRQASVSVRDHGTGIAPQDLGRVFDRFYRADRARALPGSGLGLSIVQHVAEEHGGTVTATNHPDGGAVVTLTLTADPIDRPPAAALPES